MMLGQPTAGSLTLPFATNFAENSKMLGVYFQDDWKVTRKLTLTLGLRYEIESALNRRVTPRGPTERIDQGPTDGLEMIILCCTQKLLRKVMTSGSISTATNRVSGR